MNELLGTLWQILTFETGEPLVASFLLVPTAIGIGFMLKFAKWSLKIDTDEKLHTHDA